MNRILLAALSATVAAAAMTFGARDAAAQRRITPFVGGGLATGTGDLAENTESGWLAFAGVDLPLGFNPGLTFGVTASYARVPYKGGFDEFTGVPALFGELGYVLGAESSRIVKPYLRAGAGVQLRKYDPGTTGFREQSDGGLAFSVGGALLWVGLLVSAGYLFGGIPAVQEHFSLVVLAIIALSLSPIAIEYAKRRLRR